MLQWRRGYARWSSSTPSGWAESGANLDIAAGSFTLDGNAVPVIRLAASVPFDPMLPGLATFVGLESFTIRLSHEQAYVGD